MSLGPVAHAELDAKIGAETDEQYGEGDRDQVEGADHHQPSRGGYHETHDQAEEDAQNDPGGAQCQPDYDQYRENRSGEIEEGAFAEADELLVIDRQLPRQVDARAQFG